MSKMRALSVLALMLSLTITNINNCSAYGDYGAATYGITATQEARLTEALAAAKQARTLAQQNPSTKYPGIANYIDKLIQAAEAGNIENLNELIAALDDAAYATPILLGATTQNQQTPNKTTTSFSQTPQANTTIATYNSDTTVAAVVDSKQNSVQDQNADITTKANEVAQTEPEIAELPNTGEVQRAGFGELFIAGSIIAVGVLGATLIIVRKRY